MKELQMHDKARRLGDNEPKVGSALGMIFNDLLSRNQGNDFIQGIITDRQHGQRYNGSRNGSGARGDVHFEAYT